MTELEKEHTIIDLIDLSIAVDEVKTLLEINYHNYFDKDVDPYNPNATNSIWLLQNYKAFSLINTIALDKINNLLKEYQEIENEYYKQRML